MTNYKEFAINLAKEAGGIMRANFSLNMKKEWKEDVSPVTDTDITINDLVINSVKESYPSHGILAEEKSDYNKSDEFIWICDPVDGTLPFSHGVPISTFALALTRGGEVILGVVYDPYMDRLFFAEKGKGATLNDEPIAVSTEKDISKSVISAEAMSVFKTWGIFKQLSEIGAKHVKLYSIIYSGALVAVGEFGGLIFGGRKPWDTAPLKVIIEEAGGKVTDIFGNDQRYDRQTKGFIAGPSHIHEQLLQLVKTELAQNKS